MVIRSVSPSKAFAQALVAFWNTAHRVLILEFVFSAELEVDREDRMLFVSKRISRRYAFLLYL